jgi:steroid 5-alpha reductase family enzyme
MAQLMGSIYLTLGLILLAYASLWFNISLIIRRNDVADIAWGPGYIALCAYCYFTFVPHTTALVVYGLVTLWGLRLSIHIGLRNAGKSEDFRYKKWREEWGRSFYWRSYLQVYLLQAFFLLIISTPIIMAAKSESIGWHWTSIVGMTLWCVGFYWQAVGDYQLAMFRKRKKHKDEIMQHGLWKFSRHPNYFGEILMWWAIFLVVLPLEYGLYAIVSPVLITWLLVSVSGVPMLEKKYEGNAAFEAYKAKTPALLPKFW